MKTDPFYYYGTKTFKDPSGKYVERRVCVAAVKVKRKMQIGVAVCGEKDRYNKEIARKIATGRAEKRPKDVLPKYDGKVFSSWAKAFIE